MAAASDCHAVRLVFQSVSIHILPAESGCLVFVLTSRLAVGSSADYGVLFLPLRWTARRLGLRGLPPVSGACGTRDHEAGGAAVMSGLSAPIATSGPWARKRSRSMNFCTLPEGVRGNCSTTVQ